MIVRGELHNDPREEPEVTTITEAELIHAIEHPEEYEDAGKDYEYCSHLKRRGTLVFPAPSLHLTDPSWFQHVVADADGTVSIYRGSPRNKWMDSTPTLRTLDPRQLLADLQRIIAVAEEHFGEGWAKRPE